LNQFLIHIHLFSPSLTPIFYFSPLKLSSQKNYSKVEKILEGHLAPPPKLHQCSQLFFFFFKICLNNVFPSPPHSSKCLFSSRFLHQNCVCIPSLYHLNNTLSLLLPPIFHSVIVLNGMHCVINCVTHLCLCFKATVIYFLLQNKTSCFTTINNRHLFIHQV
jgi:hypothetical protein